MQSNKACQTSRQELWKATYSEFCGFIRKPGFMSRPSAVSRAQTPPQKATTCSAPRAGITCTIQLLVTCASVLFPLELAVCRKGQGQHNNTFIGSLAFVTMHCMLTHSLQT